MSSRRESSVGAARRPSHPPSRRPATRKGGAVALMRSCPGLYRLGGGTERDTHSTRSPGADMCYTRFFAGVSRSSYSSWCAIHDATRPALRPVRNPAPPVHLAGTDATQNTTHVSTIAIRTSEPSRTTSHATHREWPHGVHAPTHHEPTHASTHSAVPHGPHSLAHNAHHHWHKEVRRERRCRDLPR